MGGLPLTLRDGTVGLLGKATNVLLYFGETWSPSLFKKHMAKMFFYLYPKAETVCLNVYLL